MGTRRRAREMAMQALFYMDSQQDGSPQMLERFCENFNLPQKVRPFFLQILNGVLNARKQIDSLK